MITPVCYQDRQLIILDQSKLPQQIVYDRCGTAEEAAEAIRTLKVRGAPLIGIIAAYAMVLALITFKGPNEGLCRYFQEKKHLLAATRPTAVNLFWALNNMERLFMENLELPLADLIKLMEEKANEILNLDIALNRLIGENGRGLLPSGCQVLTICNAGALATGGYGTALGVIRAAHAENGLGMVWVCETRPVLQGARLTVWELTREKIPVTLITDSMAGYIMYLGKVDVVIAGADRVASNGDTANKIGTYSLAMLARCHKIPFYIAAPFSTFDLSLADGAEIPVEERDPQEIKCVNGKYITVPEVSVFNPAFDITPGELISSIITEKGVFSPPYDFSGK
ncbi:MAG: S-methyl-5-thioribose-1-phosphate isomerase [Syntrophomonadaceae bacterium]|jgi:methylthioribose-1-phosphate isomerase|nr:S-methyl-5-thioribose-1-phosphate isomerase [Syntrophomonadaceae bacterium]